MACKIYFFDVTEDQSLTKSLQNSMQVLGYEVLSSGSVWNKSIFPATTEEISHISNKLQEALATSPDIFVVMCPFALLPSILDESKKRDVVKVVYLQHDPLYYGVCYREIVDYYDIVLHSGLTPVLDFYAEKGHKIGVNFPCWTSQEQYPYCFRPEAAQSDIVYLADSASVLCKDTYEFISSLPFHATIIGQLQDDRDGLHQEMIKNFNNDGYEISNTFSNAMIGLDLSEPFQRHYAADYFFPALSRLGSSQIPSRVVKYAASGLPILSFSRELSELVPSILYANDRKQAIRILSSLKYDPSMLKTLSHEIHDFFRHFLSADARANFLHYLLHNANEWGQLSSSDRATLFLKYPAKPIMNDHDSHSSTPAFSQVESLPPVEVQRLELSRKDIRDEHLWRIIVLGTFACGENDTVACLIRSLKNLGHDVLHLDFKRIHLVEKLPKSISGHGPVYVSSKLLDPYLKKFNPDMILCAAGGLCFTPEDALYLKQKGLTLLGLTLSDPDVQESMLAHVGEFDLHGTNSTLALDRYIKNGLTNTILFPFGVDRGYACATVPSAPEFAADIICMGHAAGRPERIEVMDKVTDVFDSVRLYGRGWTKCSAGTVQGFTHIQAMREGKIHVNFPLTRAGFINIKCGVFESIASGAVLFTQRFDEMAQFFNYEDEIIGYDNADELVEKIRQILSNSSLMEQIKRRSFARLANEHLYEHRWLSFFKELYARAHSISSENPANPLKQRLEDARPISRKRKIIISGFYGAKNIGDELLLKSISQNITRRDPLNEVIVASESPWNITKEHALSSFLRKDIARAQSEAIAASAVILGGGGLWHDYTFSKSGELLGLFSSNSISVTGYSKLPLLARIANKSFHVFGIGVGPLSDPNAKNYLRFLSEQTDSITVRDNTSKDILMSIEGWTKPVHVFPDPVFALDISDLSSSDAVMQFAQRNSFIIGINLRPWKHHDESLFVTMIGKCLRRLHSRMNFALLGIPFQCPQDNLAIQQLFDSLPPSIPKLMVDYCETADIDMTIASLQYCNIALSMRLHTCLLALRFGVPTVGFAYDPKIRALFEDVNAPELCLPLDTRESVLTATLQETINDLDSYRFELKDKIQTLETNAHKGFDILCENLANASICSSPLLMPRRISPIDSLHFQGQPLCFQEQNDDLSFSSPVWKLPTKTTQRSCTVVHGILNVTFDVDEPFYISQDTKGFSSPPQRNRSAFLAANSKYSILIDSYLACSQGEVLAYVIRYSKTDRLKTASTILQSPQTLISFETCPNTFSFRIAFRFSGKGHAEISRIRIFKNLPVGCC